MTDLSPAAQAVLDAATNRWLDVDDDIPPQFDHAAGHVAAAALRAAADQVVPEPPMIVEGGRTYEEAWTATTHHAIRRRFLAIAAEPEGQQ